MLPVWLLKPQKKRGENRATLRDGIDVEFDAKRYADAQNDARGAAGGSTRYSESS